MAKGTRGSRRRREIPVLWDSAGHGIPICAAMVGGIQRMAAKKGYVIKLYATAAEYMADSTAYKAVIVVGFESVRMPRALAELRADGRRIVVTSMDSDHIDAHYSCATFSRRIATEQMLDYFLARGCRRMALVGCGDRSVNDMIHSDAMARHLRKHPSAMGRSFWYGSRIAESFEAFLSHEPSFDAALCPNEYAAVAFLHFCQERDIQVPERFLLATFKGDLISRYCKPSITTLAVDFDAIGANSVMVWLFLQDLLETARVRVTVPGQIVERESTSGPLPLAAEPVNLGALDETYQGGPFYEEPTLQALMRIERCLQSGDELDMRIIGLLMGDGSYERIAEELYLSESSLQYRVRNLFRAAQVNNRRAFMELLRQNFTRDTHFLEGASGA